MSINRLRILLYPFSLIFSSVATLRNLMFNFGFLKSKDYSLPVISVGNITVGGTGKTPLTELIIRHLYNSRKCALLSRGYGRKTRGVIIAGDPSDSRTIGDEPMQIKTKFPNVIVAVSEKRVLGMDELLKEDPCPDVVIMDDAFQHRYVKPGLSIVVMDYFRPVWRDLCLPAGNLREPASGINRADIIVVNKCPGDLSPNDAQIIKEKLKFRNRCNIFFTTIKYGKPVPLVEGGLSFSEQLKKADNNLLAIAGIGNPEPFFKMTEKFTHHVKRLQFPDHHDFSHNDIIKIEELCHTKNQDITTIVTTEKDAVRFLAFKGLPKALMVKIWYIPIELEFLYDKKSSFERKIDNYVGEN